MIALGVIGVAVVLVLTDPLKARLWAVAFLLGLLMVGAGLLVGIGQPEMVR